MQNEKYFDFSIFHFALKGFYDQKLFQNRLANHRKE